MHVSVIFIYEIQWEVQMDHIEMVENLRNKANVSYSEAKDALEKANWDMLEAMILLENEGKVEKGTAEASSSGAENGEKYDVVAATASVKNDHAKKTMNNFKDFLVKVFHMVCDNFLIVRRKGEMVVKLPLLLLAVLCCACIDVVLVTLLVGLFIGCGYHIEGRNFNGDSKVNQVMNDVNTSFDHMMNNDK